VLTRKLSSLKRRDVGNFYSRTGMCNGSSQCRSPLPLPMPMPAAGTTMFALLSGSSNTLDRQLAGLQRRDCFGLLGAVTRVEWKRLQHKSTKHCSRLW